MSMLAKITSVTEMFSKSAKRHEDSYVLSMPYYMLTGRKGASLYTQDHSSLIVCKHPHIEDRLMVFPEIGGDGSLTCNVLSNLQMPSNGIQLARYTEEDFRQLTQAGKRHGQTHGYELHETEEHTMDWKYPLHILDTGKVSAMEGCEFEKLRNKFNKAKNLLTVVPLEDPKADLIMRASLMYWVGSMIYNGKETGNDLMGFYTTLFSHIKQTPDSFGGFVLLSDNEPAGFTIWDKTVQGVANGIASLSRLKIKGMSEFQTITACTTLKEQGITKYNIGGSETEGLNRHKLEYRPEKSVSLRSYEVVKNKALPSFSVHTLVL